MPTALIFLLLWVQKIHEREIIQNQYTEFYEFYIDDDFEWEPIVIEEYEMYRCGCIEDLED